MSNHRLLTFVIVAVLCLFHTLAGSVGGAEGNSVARQEVRKTEEPLQAGIVFQGDAELLDPRHNPATLRLYINHITMGKAETRDIEVEALAVMETRVSQYVYGLKGFYLSDWKQLYLYELIKDSPKNDPYGRNIVDDFEPVGLAGQFSQDGTVLNCRIAFNGRAALKLLTSTKAVEKRY